MAELAEVQRVCDTLSGLSGRAIEYIGLDGMERDRVVGSSISSVRRVGKSIVARADKGADEFVIVMYAGSEEPSRPLHMVFAGGSDLTTDESYTTEVCEAWWNADVLKTSGRDLIDESCDLAYSLSVAAKLIKDSARIPDVRSFLLDERNIAGLGPYMVSEMLYSTEIHPTRLLNEITVLDMQRLLSFGKSFASLMMAFSEESSSVHPLKTSIMKVFEKELCPEEHPVATIKDSSGSVYYCPVCQS